MMNEKFSTKRLIDAISAGMLRHTEEDAIVTKLRAADKLCEAAKDVTLYNDPKAITLRKAIADYEGTGGLK